MSDKDGFFQWKIDKGMFGWSHEYAALIDEAHDFGVNSGQVELEKMAADNEDLRSQVERLQGRCKARDLRLQAEAVERMCSEWYDEASWIISEEHRRWQRFYAKAGRNYAQRLRDQANASESENG